MSVVLKQTPSQTVGPFFAFSLTAPQYGYSFDAVAAGLMADDAIPGEKIRIVGRVMDGAGEPIGDAMIEVWQADSMGRYAHPADARGSNQSFRGFGRFGTGSDSQQRFIFETVKPGSVDGVQAPHINVIVFMRGLLTHAYTRIYFSDETEANASDPVLLSVDPDRRDTLIAHGQTEAGKTTYNFDIVMQGDTETVFFDV